MAETFEKFLEQWRKQALPTVTGRELDAVLEKRARELSELAVAKVSGRSSPRRRSPTGRCGSSFARSTTPRTTSDGGVAKMDRNVPRSHSQAAGDRRSSVTKASAAPAAASTAVA